MRISEVVRHQFAGTLGTTPVDDAIKAVKDSAQVLFHLHPMPSPPKPDRAAALQLMLKRPWSSIQEGKGKGKTDKGKGKGKTKERARALQRCRPTFRQHSRAWTRT